MFEFITPEFMSLLLIAFFGGVIGYIVGYNHGSKDTSEAWKSVYVKDTNQ